jgi:uncharacterized protein (TIGR03083 family)
MTDESWARARGAFNAAAEWFVRTTAQVGDRLEDPGLGEWTVRDLVGHTSRSLLTVEAYLSQPVAAIEVGSPAEYFRRIKAAFADSAAVAQRGRDAGAALGADVPGAVRTIADRVLALVEESAEDDPVDTIAGGMLLGDYLPTRTFELTVHTCDLARALGLTAEVPDAAAEASLLLIGQLAAGSGLAAPLLLAATGRGPLPDGFTVL